MWSSNSRKVIYISVVFILSSLEWLLFIVFRFRISYIISLTEIAFYFWNIPFSSLPFFEFSARIESCFSHLVLMVWEEQNAWRSGAEFVIGDKKNISGSNAEHKTQRYLVGVCLCFQLLSSSGVRVLLQLIRVVILHARKRSQREHYYLYRLISGAGRHISDYFITSVVAFLRLAWSSASHHIDSQWIIFRLKTLIKQIKRKSNNWQWSQRICVTVNSSP